MVLCSLLVLAGRCCFVDIDVSGFSACIGQGRDKLASLLTNSWKLKAADLINNELLFAMFS